MDASLGDLILFLVALVLAVCGIFAGLVVSISLILMALDVAIIFVDWIGWYS